MKKTSNTTRWLLAFSLIGAIAFSGCKKEESLTPLTPTATDAVELAATQEATVEEAASEAQFDDVFNITASMNRSEVGEDLGVSANVSGLSELGSTTSNTARCFTITVFRKIANVFPKTVTIDFGTGCLGRDGKFRKGKIVSIYTNRMVVPDAKVSTTFIGYHVDSFKIEGTHITENTSTLNMQGWKVKVIDGKITNTNTNRWRKWNSVKDVLQVAGNGTPHFPLDDIYKIDGAATGSNSGGHTWSSLITESLIKKFACPWIVQGKIRLNRDGRTALLDYGNGNCDNQAVIYINGIPHIITL
ncbi:MAG: hypothetical protein IPL54_16790 [Chitinophagaceae bacterium]|nr:hypothetical protein [Chitinophagaceae bacterium]